MRSRLPAAPAPGFSAACHAVTGGNPQLIRELLAALASEGIEPTAHGAGLVADLRADRIAGSILSRVGRAGAPAVALGRAVAILGRNATPALAAALAGLEPREAADAVDALIALEIFAPVSVSASSTRSCAPPSTTTSAPPSAARCTRARRAS